jgi:hypothetical protein
VATFNSDFYVTCATVIPVFFLAVAVQDNSYQEVLDSLVEAAVAPLDSRPLRAAWAYIAASLIVVIAFLVVLIGFGGEAAALFTLYKGQEEGLSGLVFVATITLLFAVVIGPILRAVEAAKLSTNWAPSDPSPADEKQVDSRSDDGGTTSTE